jgi:hypothetical protein
MSLNRYSPYIVIAALAGLGIAAFWRRGSEQRAHRAFTEHASERPRARRDDAVPLPTPHARSKPAPTRRPSPREQAPADGEEVLEGLPSWEGKPLSEYTWEERQEVGLTNEKLFANVGALHWGVLAGALEGHIDQAFRAEMRELSESYRADSQPYAPDDPEENLKKERALLDRVERTVKTEAMPAEARESFEYLKRHVEMWNTGEAEKLVDRKIERENDTAKRIALRARAEKDDPDEPSEDGNQ